MTMISSPDDTAISLFDGGSSNNKIASVEKASVQSALFNNERLVVPSSKNDHVVPSVVSGGGDGNNLLRKSAPKTIQQPKLLSRNPKMIITSSTRGNLGPPTVLNQNPPGTDWMKDRWQAASDMHGTAIKGSHWILFDFSQVLEGRNKGINMTKIALDWETAFATDYRIEGRMDRPTQQEDDDWCVLYDGGNANNNNKLNDEQRHQQQQQRNEVQHHLDTQLHQFTYGQSPGVKQKLPLHIVHTIEWTTTTTALNSNEQSNQEGSDNNNGSCQTTAFRYLRIFIRKPARGWGVSLWEVDVFGTIV